MSDIHCINVIYSGTVQGVGFRYTVENYASNLGLAGWVKNLSDGRVEMLVEGPKAIVDELCQRIEQRFNGYIRDKQVKFEKPNGNLGSFRVTF